VDRSTARAVSSLGGQLDIEVLRLSPVALPGPTSCGFSCAWNGSVNSCWGCNPVGQLGNGLANPSFFPTVVTNFPPAHAVDDSVLQRGSISTGFAHSCGAAAFYIGAFPPEYAVATCWGENNYGQLGSGSASFSSNVAVNSFSANGTSMQVTAGGFHTCATWTPPGQTSGPVACWGQNDMGQLGNGNNTGGSSAVNVFGIADAVEVQAGIKNTCARRATGEVWCWGWNAFGILGPSVAAAGTSNVPVHVPGISNAVQLAMGQTHACARLASGSIACWGSNGAGQLGNGTMSDSPMPVTVMNITDAIDVGAGGASTCAVRSDHSVWCWGANGGSELGDGTTTTRQAPTRVTVLTM
jgi:alpha-tubulin suppressor-like RCC1 family protein